MNISEFIKLLCVKRNTTIAELSLKMGNSKQNLFNKIYRNDMKVSDLEKVLAALDCNMKIEALDNQTGKPII